MTREVEEEVTEVEASTDQEETTRTDTMAKMKMDLKLLKMIKLSRTLEEEAEAEVEDISTEMERELNIQEDPEETEVTEEIGGVVKEATEVTEAAELDQLLPEKERSSARVNKSTKLQLENLPKLQKSE